MAQGKRPTVLIAEDEESLREALKLNLELEGYDVATVDNGPGVLKMVKSEYFDLIILDIMLPETDGITICETIRLQHNDVPILFLSARLHAPPPCTNIDSINDRAYTPPPPP